MKKIFTAKKILATALTGLFIFGSASAAMAHRIDTRIDGQVVGEYNSNLGQINDFPGDFVNGYIGTATFRYTAPTNTQILARLQGQYNKYINLSEFDVIALAGSFTASQWFFNSLNVYVGLQPIQQISLATDRRPFDMVYLGGITYYQPFGKTLGFAGYQLDRLNTEAVDFRSLNQTVLAGVRHSFMNNLFGNLSGRIRIRNLDIAPDDIRYSTNMNVQYLLNEWLTLQAGGDYTYVASESPARTLGFFNLGVNVIAGFNNSFNF